MRKMLFAIGFFVFLGGARLIAGDNAILKLNLPLFDLPYQFDAANTGGYAFGNQYPALSMRQSLDLTVDVYSSMHFGLKKLHDYMPFDPIWKNAVYYAGTGIGIITFAYFIPFGYPWMQQEFTRSLFARYGIDSKNGCYNIFHPGAVNGLTDDKLGQFKSENPADFIRMNSAGIEGYILFSDKMLRNIFLYDLHNFSTLSAFFSAGVGAISNTAAAFVADYGASDVDGGIDELYKNDGDEKSRKIYGISSINWVYELFRPDEPYTARGIHPSGTGIARYIKLSQLSGEEKDYLVKQGVLSMLNLISPAFYGFSSIKVGETGFYGNFALHHYLTSFGTDTQIEIMLKKDKLNFFASYHNYMNYEHYFPALEAEIIDYPVEMNGVTFLFSPRILIGLQPLEQRFKTSEAAFLAFAGLRTDAGIHKNLFVFFDIGVKTDGWLAGNEYLDPNVNGILGVSARY